MNRSTMRIPLALLLTALIPGPVTAQGLEFACEYTRKVECTPAGCQEGDVGSAYLLVPPLAFLLEATTRATEAAGLPTIKRCDASGCAAIPVRATLGDPFVNVTPLEGTYFLKIASVDLRDGTKATDFVEVATQALKTQTYFGSCKGVVPSTVTPEN